MNRFSGMKVFHRSRNLDRLFSGANRSATGLFLLVILNSCTSQSSVTLSSGTQRGYYHHLGDQIDNMAGETVDLKVRNLESKGSRQNLQRLIDHQTDFAIVQLDAASEMMQQGKVQAIALLANEPIHVITQTNVPIKTFDDLAGKRVAIGVPGSGIRYTTTQLLKTAKLTVREEDSNFDEALKKLKLEQIDAVMYVGSLGANEKLRQEFNTNPQLRLVPVRSTLINNLTAISPGSYKPAIIPAGIYNTRPEIPPQDITTIATATVVVTRPDVKDEQVGLLTWAILSNARKFSQFYPELQTEDPKLLLQKGLVYMHPVAQGVFDDGDPRNAWLRYWEANNDLQAGVFILGTTSGVGLLLQYWRKRRAKKLLATTANRIIELRKLLPHDSQKASKGIDELRQEHRVMFVDGAVPSEIYEQVQQKTSLFAEECRTLVESQRRKFVMDTLLLLDDWQETLQTNPEDALQKLTQLKQKYREMLLADQVDIEAYAELMELTLISVMTLAPNSAITNNYSHNRG